jgi:hypothetical protein
MLIHDLDLPRPPPRTVSPSHSPATAVDARLRFVGHLRQGADVSPAQAWQRLEAEGPTGSDAEEGEASVEITILVESTEPLIGRVVAKPAGAKGAATEPGTDTSFMGWLGLLRVLDDVFGSSSAHPPTSPSSGQWSPS